MATCLHCEWREWRFWQFLVGLVWQLLAYRCTKFVFHVLVSDDQPVAPMRIVVHQQPQSLQSLMLPPQVLVIPPGMPGGFPPPGIPYPQNSFYPPGCSLPVGGPICPQPIGPTYFPPIGPIYPSQMAGSPILNGQQHQRSAGQTVVNGNSSGAASPESDTEGGITLRNLTRQRDLLLVGLPWSYLCNNSHDDYVLLFLKNRRTKG